MNIKKIIRLAGFLLFCLALMNPTARATIDEPGCASLQQWAASLSSNETFEPREGIVVNKLFEDDQVIPLFGKPYVAWEREDVSMIQKWLADCRKKAMAIKNHDMGNTLYAALKEVKQAYRSLRTIWSSKTFLERQAGNLLKLKPGPEIPEILAIAQTALKGEPTENRVSALRPQWKGYGNQAAQLKDHARVLSNEEIENWIGKLEKRRVEVAASLEERKTANSALLAEIAAVPVSKEGFSQLNSISYRANPGAMTREEQDSYNQAFQNKRQQIQNLIAAQNAQIERNMTSLPAPVSQQAAAVLKGDSAGNASIRGLRPGVSYGKIKAAAKQLWDYDEALTIGGKQDKQLSTKRREFNRLKREERRDGGLLNIRTREGIVGELSYVEHFPGPMGTAPLKADLVGRFGKPDEEKQYGDGYMSMTWQDGDKYLRVSAGNRVTQDREFMGMRSSMEISLWHQDFADYLEDAARRCDKLRNKPVSELSINEKQAIIMNCLTP